MRYYLDDILAFCSLEATALLQFLALWDYSSTSVLVEQGEPRESLGS